MLNENLEEDEADVFNFIARIRQENLFIRNEKQDIQDLNKLISNKIHKVVKTSWLTNQQRFFLLEKRNKHFESITLQACRNFDLLGTYKLDTDFVDAKNLLGSQNAINISNLLHILRSQPKQLAEWLLIGEKITEDQEYRLIIQSVINGLYGSCIFAEDAKYMLTLLFEVAKQQLLTCDEPRSVIEKRTCTFRHLFFLFDEVYQPAKFFLSAALELPILELLSFNQYYLDVDHDKSIQRFRIEDNLKTFRDAVEYRNEVVARLAQFTNNFIQSMLENVYSFPKPIAWIACHIYKMIEKAFCAKEANAVTTELIFNTFIVPIIVDPEQYGIYNSQISDITRHNLIQIAKILQILALSKFEGIDKKYMDIFQTVDKNSMSNFIELLFFDMEGNEPPVEASPTVLRDIMLFTEEELLNLIGFLQKIQIQRNQNDNVEKNPTVTVTIEEHLSLLTVPSRNNSPRMNGDLNSVENSPQKKAFFSLGTGIKNMKRLSDEVKNRPSVIVFPIDGVSFEPVGMLPEDKVIDLSVPVKTENEIYAIPENMSPMKNINIVENGVQNCDAKSTYSNYQDEGSIGNTSDNLEAISEAASNHSVASSLELENEDQNDNLSDMVSANVSGRGTPNISGRDTPSSQVNENDDRQNLENRQENVEEARTQPPQISRQIRSEIDDKFCKFEIKKLLAGDETISLISETWSTDVLASDNETVDLSERMSFPMPLADQAIQEAPIERERENVLDVSETQSESAWSTDVMGSDTERLTEVDNDDAASVAQSDDTNSVPRSDDTRSETDEVAGLRRLSSCSSNYNNSTANQIPTSVQGYIANVSVNNVNYVNVTSNSPSYVTTNTTSFLSHVNGGKSQESSNFVSVNQNYLTGISSFKKVEFDTKTEKPGNSEMDTNDNTNLRSVLQTVSQQTQTSVSYNGATTTMAYSDKTQVISKSVDPNIAGPSGLNRKSSLNDSDAILKQNGVRKYENNRTNEILLSNCSLNSSSSGSSSNSFENKNSINELSNSDQWEHKPWLNSSGSSLNVTLTPSESTSELSVLSATNAMSQSVTTNGVGTITSSISRKTTVLSKGFKATSSSGPIAKSISFDMSVEKGLDDDNRSKRGGFFGKIRNGFKSRRGKAGFRTSDDFRNAGGDYNRGDIGDSPVKHVNIADVPDDILAKYRSKDFIESSPIKDGNQEKRIVKNGNRDSSESDVNTFGDIKKKLRLVLCNTSEVPYYLKRNPCSIKSKLETVLRLELGRARKLRDWSVVARISESLRCISLLDEKGCMKLIHSMKDDIMLRTTYIQYLIASKRELLFCQMYLDNLQEQIKHDRHQCEAYIATLCVREFLLQQEAIISNFYTEFSQLTLADEKYDLIQNFYRKLYAIMNDSGPWHDVLRRRGKVFEIILERYIISRVYTNALYPNGDGDVDRDRVLYKHIENLSKVVTPEHKDLMIPKTFLRESPWLPAQDALRALNSCKTPKDKLKCIKRCGRGIMDLLSISTGYPAADEFLPVLVYVIIKVNPEALLSTIQFVNSFQGQIKDGEEEYWWTGFCAAVEMIKSMDYSD